VSNEKKPLYPITISVEVLAYNLQFPKDQRYPYTVTLTLFLRSAKPAAPLNSKEPTR